MSDLNIRLPQLDEIQRQLTALTTEVHKLTHRPKYVSVKEAAEMCGLSVWYFYKRAEALGAVRFDGAVRLPFESVVELARRAG